MLGTCLAASAVGALVLTPTPAGAQSFGPSGCCTYADNSLHTYFNNGLVAGNVTSMDYAMGTRLESTTMVTDKFESWNNDTDIVVYDDYFPSSVAWSGRWQCEVMVAGSSTKCNRGTIYLNLSKGVANKALTCQEVGHSVGLDHSASTGSCMYQNASVASDNYDSHDRGHISGYYK